MTPGRSDRAARSLPATRLYLNLPPEAPKTAGKLIQISMITTPTPWRLGVHLGYRTSPTGEVNRTKHTPSTQISLMWHATYLLSYHMVSEWRPDYHLAKMLSTGGSQKPQVGLFAKKSLYGSSLEPITGFWQALTQYWIQRTQKTTRKWRKRQRKGNCIEWPRCTTFWRCRRAARSYVLPRRNLTLETSRWLQWDTFRTQKISLKHGGISLIWWSGCI